jgi:hypothetical protein
VALVGDVVHLREEGELVGQVLGREDVVYLLGRQSALQALAVEDLSLWPHHTKGTRRIGNSSSSSSARERGMRRILTRARGWLASDGAGRGRDAMAPPARPPAPA